ncbi:MULTISPECIES: DUF2188 domain-containing protein [Sediminibacillus]|uniref:DUF2188 domain-containing protein n=2 Tax=Sediminibacillus TaxID=482460 RepID=A0A1G9TRX5_9BACI|nr:MULTISPECIES: DUF2188 domain-containing protein [Sediminibacillus]QTN00970.1 DUF2188 domain-containing protein [Sediminibacillus dalangtanensis]SDM49915.1 hypothetical protein SAMN05216244_2682 [Sediminibacillus halophilus]
MKEYSVTPNKNAEGWYVKIEDVAPTDLYSKKDDAIAEAEKLASNDTPSRLMILDENHEIVEEKKY